MHDLDDLFAGLWVDYATLNPQVRRIHQLLEARGEIVHNDHIALRTFGDSRVGLDRLAAAFERFGYRAADRYVFPVKKLRARHYEHDDPARPRVFISELDLEGFDDSVRGIVYRLLAELPADLADRWDFPAAGRPWSLSTKDYEALRAQSEYAAWVAAFGFRVNHFTVSVNQLSTFPTLQALDDFLRAHGIAFNTSGGEIKGSPQVMLEQSATLADRVPVSFSDGQLTIPACYYEFARRYPLPDGRLFGGFVDASADRIFESTDRR